MADNLNKFPYISTDTDIKRIIAGENKNIDDRYVFRLKKDDLIFAMEGHRDVITISGYSGEIYITAIDYVDFYYRYYEELGHSKSEIIELIYLAVAPYILYSHENITNYALSFKHENLVGAVPSFTKATINEEARTVKAALQSYQDEPESRMLRSLVDSARELQIGVFIINSVDYTYQYTRSTTGKALFTIENIPLNSILALVSTNSETVQQFRVYEFAKNLSNLLEIVKETKDVVGLSLFLNSENGSYKTARYRPENNTLVIHGVADIDEDSPFVDYVPDDFNDEYISNITASWTLYGIELDLELFLDAIMSDPVLTKFFSLKETDKPTFMKNNSNIEFILSPQRDDRRYYNITINRQKLPSDRVVTLDRGENDKEDYEMEEGTPYITFTISGVENPYVLITAKILISGMISQFAGPKSIKDIVIKKQDILIADYQSVFDTWEPKYESVPFRYLGDGDGSLISKLQSIDKEKFPEGYARKCLGERQVDLIPQSEVTEWNKEHDPDGKLGLRALQFPKSKDARKDELIVFAVCRSNKFKYPGVKRNFDLPNRDKYGVLPCCFKKDQTKVGTNLYKYLHDLPDEEDVSAIPASQSSHEMARIGVHLGYGRRGELPVILSRILRNNGIKGDLYRFGVFKSVNSLIHCILYAIGEIIYTEENKLPAREMFVSNWREFMNTGTVPKGMFENRKQANRQMQEYLRRRQFTLSGLSQELYDDTEMEIRAKIGNPFTIFDSKIMIRVLELFFNVDIYVFVIDNKGSIEYEVPRHKAFYVKNYRDTFYDPISEEMIQIPGILILKHVGGEYGSHYELITVGGKTVLLDNDEENPGVHANIFKMVMSTYNTYTLTRSDAWSKPSIYMNLFSSFNIYDNLVSSAIKPIGQFIDFYGKCRGYHVIIPPAGDMLDAIEGSILCMPQQPSNLPVVKNIVSLPFSIVVETFLVSKGPGNTISKIDVKGDILVGIWFKIADYDMGIYVPIVPITLSDIRDSKFRAQLSSILDNGYGRSANPLVPSSSEKDGPFSHYLNVEKTLDIFLKAISELYRAYARPIMQKSEIEAIAAIRSHSQSDTFGGHDELLKLITSIERTKKSRLQMFTKIFVVKEGEYEIQGMVSITDKVTSQLSYEELLSLYKKYSNSTLVNNEQIIMQNQKLRDDMVYYVENYLIKQEQSLYAQRKTIRAGGSTRFFQSEQEFEAWIITQIYPPTIITNAREILYADKDPIMFKMPDNTIYIIQNVEYGDITRALNVSLAWSSGFNLGYHARPIADIASIDGYNLYEILGKDITVKKYNDPKYYNILEIKTPNGNKYYAAMLGVL